MLLLQEIKTFFYHESFRLFFCDFSDSFIAEIPKLGVRLKAFTIRLVMDYISPYKLITILKEFRVRVGDLAEEIFVFHIRIFFLESASG
jgi:hypothetical protein